MQVAGKTDIGKIKSSNQDSIFYTDKPIGFLPNLFIIADGMGGHKSGDTASKFVVSEITRQIKETKIDNQNIHSVLYSIITKTDKNLSVKSSSKEDYNGMGSTLILATIIDGQLIVANVGDSRLYLLVDKLRQITSDHSVVMELVANGIITKKEAKNHPDKHKITRAMGYGAYPDAYQIYVKKDDIILMCTDGLSNMIEEDEIEKILREDISLEDKVDKLINTANNNGGEDNISVILIKVNEEVC